MVSNLNSNCYPFHHHFAAYKKKLFGRLQRLVVITQIWMFNKAAPAQLELARQYTCLTQTRHWLIVELELKFELVNKFSLSCSNSIDSFILDSIMLLFIRQ